LSHAIVVFAQGPVDALIRSPEATDWFDLAMVGPWCCLQPVGERLAGQFLQQGDVGGEVGDQLGTLLDG
jgi:hypothetical protein